jgi:hypothetical protein
LRINQGNNWQQSATISRGFLLCFFCQRKQPPPLFWSG